MGNDDPDISILPGLERGGGVDTIDFDPESILALTQQTVSKQEEGMPQEEVKYFYDIKSKRLSEVGVDQQP